MFEHFSSLYFHLYYVLEETKSQYNSAFTYDKHVFIYSSGIDDPNVKTPTYKGKGKGRNKGKIRGGKSQNECVQKFD